MKRQLLTLVPASLIASCILSLTACGGTAEIDDRANKVLTKDGSVEVILHTEKLPDGRQLMKNEYVIWYKGNQFKTFVHADTLPDLGTMLSETADGKSAAVPKEYEFYVTIK